MKLATAVIPSLLFRMSLNGAASGKARRARLAQIQTRGCSFQPGVAMHILGNVVEEGSGQEMGEAGTHACSSPTCNRRRGYTHNAPQYRPWLMKMASRTVGPRNVLLTPLAAVAPAGCPRSVELEFYLLNATPGRRGAAPCAPGQHDRTQSQSIQ